MSDKPTPPPTQPPKPSVPAPTNQVSERSAPKQPPTPKPAPENRIIQASRNDNERRTP